MTGEPALNTLRRLTGRIDGQLSEAYEASVTDPARLFPSDVTGRVRWAGQIERVRTYRSDGSTIGLVSEAILKDFGLRVDIGGQSTRGVATVQSPLVDSGSISKAVALAVDAMRRDSSEAGGSQSTRCDEASYELQCEHDDCGWVFDLQDHTDGVLDGSMGSIDFVHRQTIKYALHIGSQGQRVASKLRLTSIDVTVQGTTDAQNRGIGTTGCARSLPGQLREAIHELSVRANAPVSSVHRVRSGSVACVVTDAEFASLIAHEVFGHGAEADRPGLAEGDRDLPGPPSMSVFDDATLPAAFGSYPVDDEGNPARRTRLVENGVQVDLLHNEATASQAAGRASANGRSTRWSHRAIPRVSNTVVEAEPDTAGGACSLAEFGYLLRGAGGGAHVPGLGVVATPQAVNVVRNGRIEERIGAVSLLVDPHELYTDATLFGADNQLFGGGEGGCGKDGQAPLACSSEAPSMLVPGGSKFLWPPPESSQP